jgi:hypothetical protein
MFLFHETCPVVLCLIEMSMNDVVFLLELLPLHYLIHSHAFSHTIGIYVHLRQLNTRISTICNFRFNTKELRILPAYCVCVWYDSGNKEQLFYDKVLMAWRLFL